MPNIWHFCTFTRCLCRAVMPRFYPGNRGWALAFTNVFARNGSLAQELPRTFCQWIESGFCQRHDTGCLQLLSYWQNVDRTFVAFWDSHKVFGSAPGHPPKGRDTAQKDHSATRRIVIAFWFGQRSCVFAVVSTERQIITVVCACTSSICDCLVL